MMWLWLRGSGWISTPGVSRGTTNMPFVHITKRMSATRPALVNHFSPVMTHSSPSFTAVVRNKFGAEQLWRSRVATEDLVEQTELELAVAWATEVLVEEDRPEALILHLLLKAL